MEGLSYLFTESARSRISELDFLDSLLLIDFPKELSEQIKQVCMHYIYIYRTHHFRQGIYTIPRGKQQARHNTLHATHIITNTTTGHTLHYTHCIPHIRILLQHTPPRTITQYIYIYISTTYYSLPIIITHYYTPHMHILLQHTHTHTHTHTLSHTQREGYNSSNIKRLLWVFVLT